MFQIVLTEKKFSITDKWLLFDDCGLGLKFVELALLGSSLRSD